MSGGLYIHIPFCRKKCLYCDFYSGGARIAEWEKYIDALLKELKSRQEEMDFEPNTLYIGGGTPSLLPASQFHKLIEGIYELTGKKDWEEFTIEINPEDVDDVKIKLWQNLGVNRASLGIQSLIDSELKAIGRGHGSEQAEEAAKRLIRAFKNVSADVMFGLPAQTMESYSETLERVLSLGFTHISSYSLMLEPGTAMTLLNEKGKLKLPEEEEWMRMFQFTEEELKRRGFRRYEISNYALPGYASQHNQSYWRGYPYIGLGPGAHSYDGRKKRRWNKSDIKGYISNFSGNVGSDGYFEEEELKEEEIREEYIMTRMRLTEGLNLTEYQNRFGGESKNNLFQKSMPYIRQGLMKEIDGHLCFTNDGFLLSDTILSDLI